MYESLFLDLLEELIRRKFYQQKTGPKTLCVLGYIECTMFEPGVKGLPNKLNVKLNTPVQLRDYVIRLLCLGESNDVTKTIQILVFARYFDVEKGEFTENFMCQTSLKDRPNTINIYSVKEDLIKLNVSTHNLCAVTADEAAVMKSEKKGVLNLFNEDCENETSRMHCTVHQEVLVSKAVIKCMEDVELAVISCPTCLSVYVNNEKHNILLNYNHIRLLSFDSRVQRICEFIDYVISVLGVKHKYLRQKLQSDYMKATKMQHLKKEPKEHFGRTYLLPSMTFAAIVKCPLSPFKEPVHLRSTQDVRSYESQF
ncbi:protein FAM200A-like [Arctopsyche grandis]|uniref:protein FAM200A-like n=1 Tax=Arctopsyche grandis TaxID=121162 RepID=UPI00406D6DC5